MDNTKETIRTKSKKAATFFGKDTINIEDKQPKVNEVFNSVAPSYDIMNDILSFGFHRLWKEALINKLNLPHKSRALKNDYKILDVAGGTGDIAKLILENDNPKIKVTLTDINENMLEVAKSRLNKYLYNEYNKASIVEAEVQNQNENRLEILAADAQNLPFDDNCYDCVTISFGIRNVPDRSKAFAEFYRVLKSRGRFVCLEFSPKVKGGFDKAFNFYAENIMPKVGKFVANDDYSYQYLGDSIKTFATPEQLIIELKNAGFDEVTFTTFNLGLVALHVALKK